MQKDLALFGLRIALGSIFIVHACDKLGWTDISVFWQVDNITHYSAEALIPFAKMVGNIFSFTSAMQAYWLAVIAACGELIAGWCLILGLFSRLAGLFLVLLMAVAMYFHFPFGFYGNEGGYEWAMLCLGGSQAIMFMGSGSLSLHALYRAISTEASRAT